MLFDTLKLHKLKICEFQSQILFSAQAIYHIYILYTIFPFLKFTRVITTFECLGDVLYHSKTAPLSQVIPIIMSMIIFVKNSWEKSADGWRTLWEERDLPKCHLALINCFHGYWAHAFRVKSTQTLRTNDAFQVGFSNWFCALGICVSWQFILPDTSVWSLQEAREPRVKYNEDHLL